MTSTSIAYLPLYDNWAFPSANQVSTITNENGCHSTCDTSAACLGYTWDQTHCYILTTFPQATSVQYNDTSGTYFNWKESSSPTLFSPSLSYLTNLEGRYASWISKVNDREFPKITWSDGSLNEKYDAIVDVRDQLQTELSEQRVEADQTDLFQIYYQFIVLILFTLLLLGLLAYNSTSSTMYYGIVYAIAFFMMFAFT